MSIEPVRIASQWWLVNRAATVIASANGPALRFDERVEPGLAWDSTLSLEDGDIDSTYDVVWLRPFNVRATDSTRRVHAIQLAQYPGYPWRRLRDGHLRIRKHSMEK